MPSLALAATALHAKFLVELPALRARPADPAPSETAGEDSTAALAGAATLPAAGALLARRICDEVALLSLHYPLAEWVPFDANGATIGGGDRLGAGAAAELLQALLQLRWLPLEVMHALACPEVTWPRGAATWPEQLVRLLHEHARRAMAELIPLVAVLVAVTIVVGGEGPVDAGPPGIYDALSA